eukprot:GDKK01038877.1.p1 GENE.GDKK01038877.1~~GDKK01038877.1.p1  ORF type:complete len:159 (-),score=13.33 GDKK01038877.1:96-572(-)
MSHATADLEYFQCDMCQTYMHRDIYCNHRRECKGKDSQEIKKGDVARISRDLDDETRARAKHIATLCTSSPAGATAFSAAPSVAGSRFGAAPKAVLTTTNLDKAQRQQGLRVLRSLESTKAASAMERVEGAAAASSKAQLATGAGGMTSQDIDDFLLS